MSAPFCFFETLISSHFQNLNQKMYSGPAPGADSKGVMEPSFADWSWVVPHPSPWVLNWWNHLSQINCRIHHPNTRSLLLKISPRYCCATPRQRPDRGEYKNTLTIARYRMQWLMQHRSHSKITCGIFRQNLLYWGFSMMIYLLSKRKKLLTQSWHSLVPIGSTQVNHRFQQNWCATGQASLHS